MLEVLLDSLKDTALLLPFLLAVHLLIELFEVKKLGRLKASGVLGGGFAPLLGTGVALLPQCGFSVVAGELYAKRYIRIGTLVAVFVATSDEALPILLGSAVSDPSVWGQMGLLVGIKVVMALLAGYALNLLFKRRPLTADFREDELPHDRGCCGHSLEAHDHHGHAEHGHVGAENGADEAKQSRAREIFDLYFKHPLIHTLVITAFVFAVNFILGTIIFLVTEEAFVAFMAQGRWLQPLIAVVIGLIPNCAASVMITEMFVGGSLTLGAAVAGLAVNAGLGIAVLFKENPHVKENITILVGLVLYALAAGYLITSIT